MGEGLPHVLPGFQCYTRARTHTHACEPAPHGRGHYMDGISSLGHTTLSSELGVCFGIDSGRKAQR